MFAQLGLLTFTLITYFNGIDERNSYKYATHERINNKPRLQFLGEELQELTIKLNFHSLFCTPSLELKKLKVLAQSASPLPFIKGNGEYIGVFVITEISSVTEHTDNTGGIISIQIEIKLKETTDYTEDVFENIGGFKVLL